MKKYHPEIDGLRAIAVIAVVVCHLNDALLPSGYLGVDIFFVISGFVITCSLCNQNLGRLWKNLREFYIRRFKRLAPTLITVVSVGCISITLFCKEPTIYLKTGLYSIFGLSNFYLYHNAVDYWSTDASLNPFTHTWSLAVEEQFYLIYPVLFLTFILGIKTGKQNLGRGIWILGILSIISLTSYLYCHEKEFALAYFMMPCRFWQMSLGCIIGLTFIKKTQGKKPMTFAKPWLANVVFGLMILVFFMPKEYPCFLAIIITILTAFLIISLVAHDYSEAHRLLNISVIQWLGKASYSLYLWHWVILVIARWTFGVNLYTIIPIILLMLGATALTYYFIENKLRHGKWSKSKRLCMVVVTAVIALIISFGVGKNPFYAGEKKDLARSMIAEFKQFELEDSSKGGAIYLVGNSHALVLRRMVREITKKYEKQIYYPNRDKGYTPSPFGTGEHLHEIDNVLSKLSKGDIIILSSRNYYLYEKPYITGDGLKWGDRSIEKNRHGYGIDIWFEELDAIIKKAAAKDIHVVTVLPFPEFNEPMPHSERMLKEWFRPIPEKSLVASHQDLMSRFPIELYTKTREIESTVDHYHVFDPLPYLGSPEEGYPSMKNNIPMYNDTHHISPDGSIFLLEPFHSFLKERKIL